MEFMKVMEAITVVVTLMMFSTGIIPCRQMVSTKSTKNVPYHMFLLGGLGCLGMFHYGLLVGNVVLIFLNGVGAILNTVYTFLYLSVVKSKETPLAMLLGAILYEITLYTYIFKFQEHTAERADTLGMCSSLLTLFLMILPAFEVINNIRNKNADGMPAVMLIGGILCSTCWLTYGIMLHDPNIYCLTKVIGNERTRTEDEIATESNVAQRRTDEKQNARPTLSSLEEPGKTTGPEITARQTKRRRRSTGRSEEPADRKARPRTFPEYSSRP